MRLPRTLALLLFFAVLPAWAGVTITGGITLVKEGGSGHPAASNIAIGKTAFGANQFGFGHEIVKINDGLFGNANSWIGSSVSSFIGINLGSTAVPVRSVAFGRDLPGGWTDRTFGLYELEYTTTPNPDENTASWTSIGTMDYQSAGGANFANPSHRHVFNLPATVMATGIRLKVNAATASDLTCVDELELYSQAYFEGVALVSQGGSFTAGNVAAAGAAFAKDEYGGIHTAAKLNDGTYGNANSWIGGTTDSFAGISLGSTPATLTSVAFGRDNLGTYADRWQGVYTLQVTTVPNPTAATPDGSWTTVGILDYTNMAQTGSFTLPAQRHVWSLPSVQATGFRIKTLAPSEAVCLDEIELYGVPGISSDASLSALTASTGALSPAFASGTTSYTLPTVPQTTTSLTITPTSTESGAIIKVNGNGVASGSASGSIPLSVGSNTITVRVTAPNWTTTQTYTIQVTRQSAGYSDASLGNVAIMDHSLTTEFESHITSYVVSTLAYDESSVRIFAAPAYAGTVMRLNGVILVPGIPSDPVSLNPGDNTITVQGTAQDGVTTSAYTIQVFRPGNPRLSAFTSSAGALVTPLHADTTDYNLTLVPYSTTSAMVTVTAAQADATLTLNSNQPITSGVPFSVPLIAGVPTPVTIRVEAPQLPQSPSIRTYLFSFQRASESQSDASLSGLTADAGTLSPAFVPATTDYSLVDVPVTTSVLALTPTTTSTSATVSVNGTPATSGTPVSITLASGSNDITVQVNAADGLTTRTYTIQVIRGGGLTLVEQGGAAAVPNIAREASMSATSYYYLPNPPIYHGPGFLNDGVYGNGNSWVADNPNSSVVASFCTSIVNVSGIAWGRDNTGGYTDRWRGLYIIEYTQVASPSATTPDAQWQLIGSVDYATLPQTGDFSLPARRHRWSFPAVQASGIRVRAIAAAGEDPIAIDELELYTSGPWISVENSSGTPVQNGVTLSFGPSIIRQNTNWTFRIRNVGNADLHDLILSGGGSGYSKQASATTVPVGGVVDLQVDFYTLQTGLFPCNIYIGSGASSNRPNTFHLSMSNFVGCDNYDFSIRRHIRPSFALGFPVNHQYLTMTKDTHPVPVYTITSGSLPPGLTLQPDGRITGTATQVGRYFFTFIVTDALSCSSPTQDDYLDVENNGWIAGGGSFAPRNLALGHSTFAKDNVGTAPHSPAKVNDGIYGNNSSWIAGSLDSFVGINFGATPITINRAAISRDNTWAYNDRRTGIYTLQYTTVPNPGASTPDASWITLQAMTALFEDPMDVTNRLLFGFSPAIQATGFRLKTVTADVIIGGQPPQNMAIDEIELYGPDPAPAWRTQHFGAATTNIGDLDDFDGDGIANLLELALGTLPNNAARGPLSFTGNVITPGQPVSDGTNAVFIRRKDRIAAGLVYTVEFSPDLTTWTPSTATPTVLADDGTHEVVSVPMPALQTRHFFRVRVATTP